MCRRFPLRLPDKILSDTRRLEMPAYPALYVGSVSRGCSVGSCDELVEEVGAVGLVVVAGVVSLAE
jgi:hypothetical protein